MTYTHTKGKALSSNNGHRSISSNLIPTEASAQSICVPLGMSRTIDDGSWLNTDDIESDMYSSEYPSFQQRQYVFLQAGAIPFIAFAASQQ